MHRDPSGHNPFAVRCACYAGAAVGGYVLWAIDWGTDGLYANETASVGNLLAAAKTCLKKKGMMGELACLNELNVTGKFEPGEPSDTSETRNGRCFGWRNRTLLSADFFDRTSDSQATTLIHESYHACREDWTEDYSYDYAKRVFDAIENCMEDELITIQ